MGNVFTKIRDSINQKKRLRAQISAAVLEAYAKEEAYKSLVNAPLNYSLIQDFVNAASQGVEVNFTLSDGTAVKIVRNLKPDLAAIMAQYRELM